MNHFSLVLAISLICTGLSAQNLALAQLLDLRKKSIGEAEEYLTSKGWEFFEAEDETYENFGSASFSYNKSDISSGAESFLFYMYSSLHKKTRILLQINDRIKYNEYLNSIKAYGGKQINSTIEDGSIVKTYRGATTTFIVIASTGANFYGEKSATWVISILTNEDYDLTFAED